MNGIDQEVGQDLANLNRAAENVEAVHSGFGQFESDVDAHFQGLGLNAVDRLLARINDVAWCEGEGEAVRLQLGDGVEVFNQLRHAADVVVCFFQKSANQFFVLEIGFNQRQG